ncbi:C-type lectin domain family 2 member D2 [Ochotona princeps]|uniref:C-type lectin domain family 2 member D2 n=1 Tax=Ochotona princeps TaxID=9978 RepID=UPI0027150DA6|nr:C-type lectin domain family 2 member D2 [Ochotona princeps]
MNKKEDEKDEEIGIEEPARRPKAKKVIIISTLLCAGLAFLLWGILSFPKKFGTPKISESNLCTENIAECPHGWDQIKNTCYFQSEHETTWLSSQENCKTHSAFLAKFDSREELESLIRHLKPFSYWIDVNRHSIDIWSWTIDKPEDDWFQVGSNEKCTYVATNGLGSADCSETKRYICSKSSECL